jgi:hypothetical protein
MFDRVSQAAEKLATGVSRRGFLGSVGRWAGATAAALAGVLTTAGAARAGGGAICCQYQFFPVGRCVACLPAGSTCPAVGSTGFCLNGSFFHSFIVAKCSHCF